MRLYQTAARVWLTAAGLSLLLPAQDRFGVWLPLHLALAGAISVAISGAMQMFAATLTATASPAEGWVLVQFITVNVGAALIGAAYPGHHTGLVALGGSSFVAGMLVLLWMVLRARRRSLHARHRLPLAMYVAALTCVLVGATLGALIGSGVVDDPVRWLDLRSAHLSLNVLGWVSLTIAGTLVTMLPTVLRVQMPAWHGVTTDTLLIAGVTAIATGFAAGWEPLVTTGGLLYAAGAVGLGWMVVRVVRVPRKWPVPTPARHLLAAVAWFIVGSMALAVTFLSPTAAVAEVREVLLVSFVGGWALQTLLGTWLYLLPMSRPGHPDERRRWLTVAEIGGRIQVLGLNGGLILMALAGVDLLSSTLGSIGLGLALGFAAVALAKGWAFVPLSRLPLPPRLLGVWGA